MFKVQSVNDTFIVGCKPYSFCFNSYVGQGIKKLNDFLQNQSHPPTVEVAKEWKRRLTGADGEGHESPCVCKLLDKVEFVTHRQFGARSLLTHFCVIRSALKQRLTEVSGLIDEYIESGGKRDFAEIIKHGLNEEGNKQVQYVSSDGKAVLTEQIVYKLVNLFTSTELINLDPVSAVWFGFLFKDPDLEEDAKQEEVEEGEATCRESCSDGESEGSGCSGERFQCSVI